MSLPKAASAEEGVPGLSDCVKPAWWSSGCARISSEEMEEAPAGVPFDKEIEVAGVGGVAVGDGAKHTEVAGAVPGS